MTTTALPRHHRLPERSPEYRRMARKLAKRQSIGEPVDDEKDENGEEKKKEKPAWPLAAQLRREGNEVLLQVAERYRSVYDASAHEPLLVGREPDTNLVYDTQTYTKEDGTIVHLGVRKERLKRHEAANDNESQCDDQPVDELEDDKQKANNDNGPNKKKKPVTFPPRSPKKAAKKWDGDAGLIAHIDGARMLRRLQQAIGPLLGPFEDAVLHGETLTAIGEAKGMNSVASGSGGRVLVMMGLEVAQRCFAEIDRDIAVDAAA